MLPKFHIVTGLIFSIILYLLFPSLNLGELIAVFLASFLIDFDHYIYYVIKKRNFSIKRAYNWFKEKGKKFSNIPGKERKKYILTLSFFHGLEWVILFFILGKLFYSIFYFVAIGMLFHLIFDWINSLTVLKRFFKFSIIFDYFYNRNLKEV